MIGVKKLLDCGGRDDWEEESAFERPFHITFIYLGIFETTLPEQRSGFVQSEYSLFIR